MVLDTDNIFPVAKDAQDEFFISEAEEALQPRIVIKSADESVTTSTTLQDDDELFMSVSAGRTYEFELLLNFDTDSNADPGIKLTFVAPTGSTGFFYVKDFDVLFTNLSTHILLQSIALGDTLSGDQLDVVDSAILIKGTVKTGNDAGNLQLQWCQDSSDGDATIVKENSSLKVTRQ